MTYYMLNGMSNTHSLYNTTVITSLWRWPGNYRFHDIASLTCSLHNNFNSKLGMWQSQPKSASVGCGFHILKICRMRMRICRPIKIC